MNAPWNEILPEMAWGTAKLVIGLLKVIVPLMVGIELLLAYGVVERLAPKLTWLCRLLGIGKDAVVPLLVGTVLGITYGGGALAEINRRTPLSKRDMALLGIFLSACHGVIETTYLFWMAGASAFFVCVVRLLIAVCVTAVCARIMRPSP